VPARRSEVGAQDVAVAAMLSSRFSIRNYALRKPEPRYGAFAGINLRLFRKSKGCSQRFWEAQMLGRYIAIVASIACATCSTLAFAGQKPYFSGAYQFMGHIDCLDRRPFVFSGTYNFDPDAKTVNIEEYSTSPGPNVPLDHRVDSASFSVSETKLFFEGIYWTISSHSDAGTTVQSATFIARHRQCSHQLQMFR
jgi:hypothetical protein